jgi:hypothetical protein
LAYSRGLGGLLEEGLILLLCGNESLLEEVGV